MISQVYGGGGNTGAPAATLKNDFIELHNRSGADVSVDGWSVQYAASTGSSWQVTALAGTIPAGGYYLIQEAAGTGGTADLPAPEATGSIPMAAGAGKVWLVSGPDALSGTCPTGPLVVDQVSFGTAATNCGRLTTGTLANNTAAIRKTSGNGCSFSDTNLGSVFDVATPTPRNHGTTPVICTPTPFVTMSPTQTTIGNGTTQQFQAVSNDASGTAISETLTWTSSTPGVATVNSSGLATAVAAGTTTITARSPSTNASATATLNVVLLPAAGSDVVISQIYGGGGNSGATLKNDYIELFNRGTVAANLAGWSVQYASSTGGFTQVTPLTGTIAPGAYYLIQEAAGTGGTTALPTPVNATGSINMSGTAGKIALALTTTPLADPCPSNVAVLDLVAYGSGTNCGGTTANLSATTAALRNAGGCKNTHDPSVDFTVDATNPRNSASPVRSCIPGTFDHIALTGPNGLIQQTTAQFSADAEDGIDNSIPNTTFTWTSTNTAIATVDANGLVTANSTPGTTTITATATVNSVQKSASIVVSVFDAGIHWVDVGYNTTSLPPGFQANMFMTARQSQGGLVIPATFTVEALDPTIANVIPGTSGIMIQALSIGVAHFRITAKSVAPGFPDYVFETSASTSLTVETPVDAPTSIYGNNDEFGDPTQATIANANDMLIRRPQYVLSYNQSRGTPNWVSYELDARQFGAEDRCNCFTADPNLPVDKRIYTTDYTSGGYDRGHMTRSADRTATNDENAATYYLTNVVPQQGDLNQGVWAQFENALGDSAKLGGRAVYIITGPLYSSTHPLTFLKGEGKVAIPDSTWKIAVIGPRSSGNPFTSGGIHTIADMSGITVLAVNMPNITGVRNDPWAKYLTTIDKIEKSTGYDFLSVLPKDVQCRVEVRNCDPTARISGDVSGITASGVEGQTLHFDASTSTDPDNDQLQYQWSVNGAVVGIGATLDYTFPNNGSYEVKAVVGDGKGGSGIATITATITNVAPVVGAFAGGTVDKGAAFTSSGAFTDPGADTWTGTVTYGDQSAPQPLTLNGKTFSLNHTYAVSGTFTVTVTISDGDASSSQTASVTVVNHPPVAQFSGPNSANEGLPLTFNSTSTDPDAGDILSYQWTVTKSGSPIASGIGATFSFTPDDNGTYSVNLLVSDLSGASSTTAAALTVANVAPTATFSAPNVDQGSPITLSFSAPSDASSADVAAGFKYAFDCGSGFGSASPATSATCATAQSGTRTVRGRILDKDGGSTDYSATVSVANVAPIVNALSGATINTGATFTSAGSFTDPGTDVWTATVNYGDGTGSQPLALTGKNFSLSHVYTVPGTFTATVSVSDGVASSSQTASVTVVNHPPVASITGAGVSGGNEGQALAFDASTSTDPDGDALSYQWSVNGTTAGIGPALSYTFPNNGSYDVKVIVADPFGGSSSTTVTVAIANVAPAVSAFAGASVNKGSPYTASGSFTDPGTDTWTATVNYGDGTGVQPLSLSGKTFSLNHTYSVAATFTVTVTVNDGDASASQTASVTVVNHPPVAHVTGAGLGGGNEGTPLTFDASTSTDPDNGDVLSYQWSVNGQVVGIASTLSYAFPDNGTYTVGLIVSDLSGASNSTSSTVAIANVAPTGTLTAPATVTRGGTIAIAVTNVTDRSSVDQAAGFTYAFDCATGAGYGAFGSTPTATCSALQAGTRIVHAKVRDKDNGVTEMAAAVSIVAEATALVRHAPQLNGNIDGSLQMFLGEAVTMNGNSKMTGALYVPGTPTVRLNGNPTLGANVEALGSTSPSGYVVTLNGGVSLASLVRRTDASAMPSVAAPATPAGTRTVQLNSPSDQVGDWSTVRNLTLNGNVAPVSIPGGAYGEITVNGSNKITLGTPGVTTVYNFQRLNLNGQAVVEVAGPVVVTVGNSLQVNGPAVGAVAHPEWLTLQVAQGDLAVNGNGTLAGIVIVPNGTVTVNGGSSLIGGLAADRLTLNGNSQLKVTLGITTP